MKIKIRYENEYQTLEVENVELERWLNISISENESQEDYEQRIQDVIEERFNRPDYNNWHIIAKELNEKGVPTKKGGKWTGGTINGILTNEKYIGDALFQKTITDAAFKRKRNYGEEEQYYCEDHHEAIIDRDTFEKAKEAIRQRGLEKGNCSEDTSKYQNRYVMSGKIKCGECGRSFKRRYHYTSHGRSYNAWCCGGHLEDSESCSMKYIRDDDMKRVFLTMMNKLRFGNDLVLKPLLIAITTDNSKKNIHSVEEIEKEIAANEEQRKQLNTLLTRGYLERPVFAKAHNKLITEYEHLIARRDMIDDCKAGNIDMIITKSISRFARNTLDCLKYIRQLKDMNIPVLFEKESINTMDAKGEVLITIMASLAQQESQSLSQNVKLGLQYRYQQGKVQINHNRFLGYTKDADGNLIIDPEQAEIVKRIYREYLEGISMDKIAAGLERDGILTGAGGKRWHTSTINKILRNEKYIGDALLQKTYTTDFLNKTRVKNNGLVPQYYCPWLQKHRPHMKLTKLRKIPKLSKWTMVLAKKKLNSL